MVANVLNYLFQIIMGRLLNTTDYGILSALFSLITIFSVPAAIISVIVSKYLAEYGKSDERATLLIKKLFIAITAFAVAFFILSVFISPLIAGYIHISETLLVTLTMLFVSLNLIFSLAVGVLQGEKKFLALGFFNLINPVIKTSLGFFLVYAGYRLFGVLGAILAGGFISVTVGIYVMRDFIFYKKREDTPAFSFGILKYSLGAFIVSICFAYMSNMDILLIKHFFSPQLTGIYSMASVLGRIILYIPNAFVIVLFPTVAESAKDFGKTLAVLKKTLCYILILIFASVAFLNLFPGFVIKILYGSSYAEAVTFLHFVTLMIIPLSFITVQMNYYLAINKTKLIIITMAAACFINTALIYCFHNSIITILLIMSAVYFAVMLINFVPIINYHRVSVKKA